MRSGQIDHKLVDFIWIPLNLYTFIQLALTENLKAAKQDKTFLLTPKTSSLMVTIRNPDKTHFEK